MAQFSYTICCCCIFSSGVRVYWLNADLFRAPRFQATGMPNWITRIMVWNASRMSEPHPQTPDR